MEFPTIGLIPTDPPSEDLKPFMKRKLKTWFRSWEASRNGKAERKDLLQEATEMALMLPEEQRPQAVNRRMSKCNFVLFCDKKSDVITEEEFVESWMERIYADPESRRQTMDKLKGIAGIFFRQMDVNKNGHIEYEEFQHGMKIFNADITKILFGAIDADNDGIISMHEFVYGLIYHHMSSGPESPFSLWFGPVMEDES